MAGTRDLAARRRATSPQRGGSVRLIGDDQQLAAVAAGGVLRDIAAHHGAVSLTEVVRFTDPDTGAPTTPRRAASLALRDGDPAALGFYARPRPGPRRRPRHLHRHAYAAWAADRAAGRDAHHARPHPRAGRRAQRPRPRRPPRPARPSRSAARSRLADGTARLRRRRRHHPPQRPHPRASAPPTGSRTATGGPSPPSTTTAPWTSSTSAPAGTSPCPPATSPSTSTSATPPPCTAPKASPPTPATPSPPAPRSRQLLYVALTRGRHANHLYLATAGDGDPHSVITRDALLPPTAVDLLTRVLARDGARPRPPATTGRSPTRPPARRQPPTGTPTRSAPPPRTASVPDALAAIDTAAEAAVPGLTAQRRLPGAARHLALCAVAGHDPADLLRRALAWPRGLDDARDAAAVLDWRLDPTGHRSTGTGPLPWLPGIPDGAARRPRVGPLPHRPRRPGHRPRRRRRQHARAWTPTSAPAWALPLLDRDPDLVADLAVWRAAHGVDDTDRRPTGPALPRPPTPAPSADSTTRVVAAARRTGRRRRHVDAARRQHRPAHHRRPLLADLGRPAHRGRPRRHRRHRPHSRRRGDRPLPDEQPAAALWWRLRRPPLPRRDDRRRLLRAETLRPDWTPSWPPSSAARPPTGCSPTRPGPRWSPPSAPPDHAAGSPTRCCSPPYELLCAGQPDDEPLRPDELTTALVWRIGVLTDPTSAGTH